MSKTDSADSGFALLEGAEKVFSVNEANRSLVLVRRVTKDIVSRYAELMHENTRREELSRAAGMDEQLRRVQARIETLVEELHALHAELSEIGCVLKDWSEGMVDFPSLKEGRRVWLCWRLGEPLVEHWHELDENFSRRRNVEDYFG
jgi:hypothetical protein